jgi:transposase-like protein
VAVSGLDATYLEQREGGRIVSIAAIIAVAANTGRREIVGPHIGPLGSRNVLVELSEDPGADCAA